MKKLSLLSIVAATLFSCGEEKKETKTEVETTTEVAIEEAPATYSTELEAQLLNEMNECNSRWACEAAEKLGALGAQVTPKLESIAVDNSLTEDERGKAILALEYVGPYDGGNVLLEAVKSNVEDDMRGDLAKAIVKTESQTAINGLLDLYGSKEIIENENRFKTPLINAFSTSSSEKVKKAVMTWAKANYSADNELHYVDMIKNNATEADKEYLNTTLASSKNHFARTRLAVKLVKLGDTEKINTVIEGMKKGDQYETSGAAISFADIADKCPDDKKAEVSALIEKIKAESGSALTNSSYDKSLEILK